MSVSAVSSTSTAIPMTAKAGDSTITATATTGSQKTLDVNDFLKLLAVQMNSQDPMNPTQDTQFIAQMASFTSLQQMNNLTSSMTTFQTQQTAATAQGYLGKNVTVLDPNQGGSASGVVSAVTFESGSPKITVNGKSYDPATITAVQSAAAAATTTGSSTTGTTTTTPATATTTPATVATNS